MYEKNGIVYGDAQSNTVEVTSVKVLDNMILLLTFSNGKEKLYDCTRLLAQPVFKPLEDNSIFTNPQIVDGAVTWDNEKIDVAPETMYADGYDYNKKDVLVA
ncbi:MAG: DUF2442 domain-containing protein [Oscillospiraceae bacterium]